MPIHWPPQGQHPSQDEYTPVDPTLESWDHGIAELRVDGELRAYLACVVTGTPRAGRGRGPWPWFVQVWPDGTTELPEDDYGPRWPCVQELDCGHYTGPARPRTERERTLLGIFRWVEGRTCPDDITYDVTWQPPDRAAKTWERLGLSDKDF